MRLFKDIDGKLCMENFTEDENQINDGEKLSDAEEVFESLKDRYGCRFPS